VTLATFFFERLAGVEDGFVFDGRGDDVPADIAGAHSQDWLCHDAEDGVVVGFCAAAGNRRFPWGRAPTRAATCSRAVSTDGASALAWSVDGGSVGEFGGENREAWRRAQRARRAWWR